jgi:hypothetical protein
MKLFIAAIFVLCIIPVMSLAIAQEDSRVFFVLIQIIQRDNDGNLIAYIETNDVAEINQNITNMALDLSLNDLNRKIFDIQGRTIEKVTVTTPLSTDASGLLATVKFQITDNNGFTHEAVRFSHDGMRLNHDEQVTVIWTFLRTV